MSSKKLNEWNFNREGFASTSKLPLIQPRLKSLDKKLLITPKIKSSQINKPKTKQISILKSFSKSLHPPTIGSLPSAFSPNSNSNQRNTAQSTPLASISKRSRYQDDEDDEFDVPLQFTNNNNKSNNSNKRNKVQLLATNIPPPTSSISTLISNTNSSNRKRSKEMINPTKKKSRISITFDSSSPNSNSNSSCDSNKENKEFYRRKKNRIVKGLKGQLDLIPINDVDELDFKSQSINKFGVKKSESDLNDESGEEGDEDGYEDEADDDQEQEEDEEEEAEEDHSIKEESVGRIAFVRSQSSEPPTADEYESEAEEVIVKQEVEESQEHSVQYDEEPSTQYDDSSQENETLEKLLLVPSLLLAPDSDRELSINSSQIPVMKKLIPKSNNNKFDDSGFVEMDEEENFSLSSQSNLNNNQEQEEESLLSESFIKKYCNPVKYYDTAPPKGSIPFVPDFNSQSQLEVLPPRPPRSFFNPPSPSPFSPALSLSFKQHQTPLTSSPFPLPSSPSQVHQEQLISNLTSPPTTSKEDVLNSAPAETYDLIEEDQEELGCNTSNVLLPPRDIDQIGSTPAETYNLIEEDQKELGYIASNILMPPPALPLAKKITRQSLNVNRVSEDFNSPPQKSFEEEEIVSSPLSDLVSDCNEELEEQVNDEDVEMIAEEESIQDSQIQVEESLNFTTREESPLSDNHIDEDSADEEEDSLPIHNQTSLSHSTNNKYGQQRTFILAEDTQPAELFRRQEVKKKLEERMMKESQVESFEILGETYPRDEDERDIGGIEGGEEGENMIEQEDDGEDSFQSVPSSHPPLSSFYLEEEIIVNETQTQTPYVSNSISKPINISPIFKAFPASSFKNEEFDLNSKGKGKEREVLESESQPLNHPAQSTSTSFPSITKSTSTFVPTSNSSILRNLESAWSGQESLPPLPPLPRQSKLGEFFASTQIGALDGEEVGLDLESQVLANFILEKEGERKKKRKQVNQELLLADLVEEEVEQIVVDEEDEDVELLDDELIIPSSQPEENYSEETVESLLAFLPKD